jgi:hypothetical protein
MSGERAGEALLLDSTELTLISADRLSGDVREDTLRFVFEAGGVYLLSPTDTVADWYRNIEKDHGVVVRIKRRGFRGRASAVEARQRSHIVSRFKQKYGASFKLGEPSAWLPVRIEIDF